MQLCFMLMTMTLVFAMWPSRAVKAIDQADKVLTNSIGMKLQLNPKGTFDMGSAANDPGADLDEPQHQVTLSRDFYIGQFEVTQSQHKEVMGTNPSQFPRDKKTDPSNYPVDEVSWIDAAILSRGNAQLSQSIKLHKRVSPKSSGVTKWYVP
ncbi:MAG: formylglycine-generating enzyme family protein [Pirellula sp.]|jgi:formylglycine-generating enzyme required for sulfatase activity